MTSWQIAWPFTPIDQDDSADFIKRWLEWFADGIEGKLRLPRYMPERIQQDLTERDGCELQDLTAGDRRKPEADCDSKRHSLGSVSCWPLGTTTPSPEFSAHLGGNGSAGASISDVEAGGPMRTILRTFRWPAPSEIARLGAPTCCRVEPRGSGRQADTSNPVPSPRLPGRLKPSEQPNSQQSM